MKFRKKGPIEVKVRNKQGETFTLQFNLIDYVPRGHTRPSCCSFCPYEDVCDNYPDPRDLKSSKDFNNFCADMDEEIGEGKWVPIPVPESLDALLKKINEIQKEKRHHRKDCN